MAVSFHLALAVSAVAVAGLVLLASGYAVLTHDYRRILIDRLLLAAVALLLLAGVTGLLVFATSRRLSDPLHLVYGLVVVAALPVARYLARQGTPRRRGSYMMAGTVVSLALLARLSMTGG